MEVEQPLQRRQHDITRDEHTRMVQSLSTARSYLKSARRRPYPEEEIAAMLERLNFLQHVLEFSATWNGVLTELFFPETETIQRYLKENDLHRLGNFFDKPFAAASKELRTINSEYPLLLKKLYEAYYLRTMRRSATPTVT